MFTVALVEHILHITMRVPGWAVNVVWVGALMVVTDCAPVVKRDLSKTPVGQVGFDDMCDLQTYFDKITTKEGTPPAVVLSSEVERERPGIPRSGRSRFAFETDFQVQTVRRVLGQNWTRLPDEISSAPRIEIEVRWSERAGLRRVVTNEDAELTIGRASESLPYHPCLSELLFGAPLYTKRREVLGLAPLPTASPWLAKGATDAGTHDAAGRSPLSPDAGSGSPPAPAPAPAPAR